MTILCHPLAESFNHAVARRVVETLEREGHAVSFHDLYGESFDPVLSAEELRRGVSFDETVLAHSRELAASGGLVFVHPDWWGQPPALLKGWLDRVLRPGVAFELEGEEFLPKRKRPLLTGKKALVFCTSDAPAGGSPSLLVPLWEESVLGYCGVAEAECLVLCDLHNLRQGERTDWLKQVEGKLRAWFPREASPSRPERR